MKAIIIGGGIGGLAAAIALQNTGHEAHVYERVSDIHGVGAGIVLWPNAVKALGKLGLGNAIQALAVTNGTGGINTQHGKTLSYISMEESMQHFGAPTFVVHRAELHQQLMSAVKNLHTGKKCAGFEQTSTGVTVRFEDGTQDTGDLLIGSDGIKSVVRQQLFPTSTPRYAGYTAWRGLVPFDHSRVKIWGESWGAGARFGITPVIGNRIYWYATQNTPAGVTYPDVKTHLLDLFRGWHEPVEALLKGTDPSQILHNDIYDLEPLKTWSVGRVTLLGDAAHAMTPNMGQGACQAIEDAVVLANCVNETSNISGALKRYESERIGRTTRIVNMSRMIGTVAQWENPVLCAARNTLFKSIPAKMRIKQLGEVAAYEV